VLSDRARSRDVEKAGSRIHSDDGPCARRRQQRRIARAATEIEHPLRGLQGYRGVPKAPPVLHRPEGIIRLDSLPWRRAAGTVDSRDEDADGPDDGGAVRFLLFPVGCLLHR